MNETMRDVVYIEDIMRAALELIPGDYMTAEQLVVAKKIGDGLGAIAIRLATLQMALGEAVSMARKGNTQPLEKCYDMLLSIQLKR